MTGTDVPHPSLRASHVAPWVAAVSTECLGGNASRFRAFRGDATASAVHKRRFAIQGVIVVSLVGAFDASAMNRCLTVHPMTHGVLSCSTTSPDLHGSSMCPRCQHRRTPLRRTLPVPGRSCGWLLAGQDLSSLRSYRLCGSARGRNTQVGDRVLDC